jgi:hypothetical protein
MVIPAPLHFVLLAEPGSIPGRRYFTLAIPNK